MTVIPCAKVPTTPPVSQKPVSVRSAPNPVKTRGLAMDALHPVPATLVVAINAALATLRTARLVEDTITITVAETRVNTLLEQITKAKATA